MSPSIEMSSAESVDSGFSAENFRALFVTVLHKAALQSLDKRILIKVLALFFCPVAGFLPQRDFLFARISAPIPDGALGCNALENSKVLPCY